MHEQRPHLILLGGFLGAGKTSAMLSLARWLPDQGLRATFVTNDQGIDLVDTRLLRSCGLTTEEIPGGCFCCRFDELAGATRRRGVLPPDVIVAEAVGSCTDLAATVTYPMRRLLSDACTVAPLSVLVDPIRGRRTLGLDGGATFSEAIQYIYRKQLEEADLLVITKSDQATAVEVDELREALQREYPLAEVMVISSRTGSGTDHWFRRIVFREQLPREAMSVNYDRYADGEARLGWLNARGVVRTAQPADGNDFLRRLVTRLQEQLRGKDIAVAHLKMTLQDDGHLAAINLVASDREPIAAWHLDTPVTTAFLTVNLRAEAPPKLLESLLHAALADCDPWTAHLDAVEAFRPGRPEPTHRDATPPVTPP